MNNKIFFENSKILLKRKDKEYTFEKDYIENMVNEILKINYLPKIKNNNILFLLENDQNITLRAGKYNIEFLKINSSNTDIIEKYNSKKYRLMFGFEDDFENIFQLESFFDYSSNVIIVFNSYKMRLINEVRGIFNGETYYADFFSKKQYVYMCEKYNFHIKDMKFEKSKEYENVFILENKKMFIPLEKCNCGKNNAIIDIVFEDFSEVFIFETKNNKKHAISKYSFIKNIINLSKYILESSIKIENKDVLVDIVIYNKNEEENIKKIIKEYFSKILENNNIKEYNIIINTDIFE